MWYNVGRLIPVYGVQHIHDSNRIWRTYRRQSLGLLGLSKSAVDRLALLEAEGGRVVVIKQHRRFQL